MEEGLQLRVLGAIELRRGGEAVAVGGPKPRLVLAMLLAARGSVVSVDRLCEELWGEDQPADPGAVLQSHLSRLRRILRPEGEIVARPPGYALEVDDERIDAGRFEQLLARAREAADPQTAVDALDAALTCFGGPPFVEFADRDWARSEAVRLGELRVKVSEDRNEAVLALGGHAGLIPELEALVADHPLRERPWQQLVLALYRSGRTADALRRVTSLRKLLRDELGLGLSPGMRELEARVLADDPTLLLPSAEPRPAKRRPPPAGTTRLVGRDAELDGLVGLLRAHRLVTLTGPGGVGKTRLAQRLAAETWDEFGGEVFVVELAALGDPASTVAAVATAVDVHPRQYLSMEETLSEYLRERRALLLLDNCEHLRAAVASLVERLLNSCPAVTVLSTSREVLGLPGEHVWRVEPLAVADADADLAAVGDAPAVRLFVERAAASRPGFELGADNAPAVGEIVRRLDGLPLAIELAAARLRVMSPSALAERLDDHLELLGGAQTSMIPRHRSLEDLVTWSHDLLDDGERRLFARLGVFAGTFGLDAVEAVCGDEGESPIQVSVLLANLVDKSMVQLVDADRPCYRLLATLRDFGRAQLDGAERARVEERHARWYLTVAERSAEALAGPDEPKAAAALDRAFDNLRAAHSWAVDHGDTDLALRLVAALREYAFRSMRAEVIGWADETLEAGVGSHPRGPVVLAVAAYGRFVRGDLEGAIELGGRAVATAEAIGSDCSGLAERTLANAWFFRGDVGQAIGWMDRMIASAREGGSARLAHALYMRSVAFTSVGDSVRGAQLAGEARAAARRSGAPTALAQASYALGLSLESTDPVEAAAHLQHAADLAEEAGNRWIQAFALTEVLWLEARQGRSKEALARYADVIDLWYRGGDWANQWLSLRHVFGILVERRDHHGAATLHGALTAAGAAYALPFEAADAEHLSELVHELRVQLGPAAFAVAVRRGASMTDAQTVAFVQAQIRALSA
jgi:predicted ATPase/DNA-binding SARP family transcriptional activator